MLGLECKHRFHKRLTVQHINADAQSDRPERPTPVFLRMRSVMTITGLGRSTIYRLIASKQFPCPVRLSAHAVAWRTTDIDAWSETRPAATH